MRTKHCIVCSKVFENRRLNSSGHWIGKYTLRGWINAKFCSYKCYWKNGRDEKTKMIMAKTQFKKGFTPWNRAGGLNRTERQKAMGKLEYKLWRKAVFERDNYTCQMCWVRGGELQADHIKSWGTYPELRYAIDNGRILCKPCHLTTNTWGSAAYWKIKKASGYID